MTRAALIVEYGRLCVLLEKAGSEPVVTGAVLEAFSDAELGLIIRDCALRLIQMRRLQA
jgi:hypothetical protein